MGDVSVSLGEKGRFSKEIVFYRLAGTVFSLELVGVGLIEPLLGQVGFTTLEHGDMMDAHCSTNEEG